NYRLPTEAEWEYAAREGGKKVRFGNGKDIANPKDINFNVKKDYKRVYSVAGEYRQKTTPVSQFKANALGLHDMSGNVWEWCADHWHENYEGAPLDASAWTSGGDSSRRVVRGGSWLNLPDDCRAACRIRDLTNYGTDLIGFRLAR
ncbi:MAG: formylglycine-generating enzyme family protein, partial [Saprospiraceae bacterium]